MTSKREKVGRIVFGAVLLAVVCGTGLAIQPGGSTAGTPTCPTQIDVHADQSLQSVSAPLPAMCIAKVSNGYPIPDPACTPGAVNQSVTIDVLRDPNFKTSCLRDRATSAREKAVTYDWYGVPHPAHNQGATQTCELDHLVSLEIGGADTLDNIWPQCGPDGVELRQRYFKQKDIVENYLAHLVKTGQMELGEAQKGIAADWTQYLQRGKETCPAGVCPKVAHKQ